MSSRRTAIAEVDNLALAGNAHEILPDFLKPRVYGEKITMPVPLGLLIRLDQVRGEVNPAIGPLQESISQSDLINQIDVARLSREALEEYIEFVNRVWRSSYSIEDYRPDDNGNYFLVIAGHSRVEAIAIIEAEKAEHARSLGFESDPGSALVWAKIIDNPSPEDIISIQLDENIYKMPSEERRAMAIVETYMFGTEKGKWATKAEFLKHAGKKFSKDALDNALFFVSLDPVHRDLVFCGAVKYGPAIEVARSIMLFRRYIAAKHLKASVEDISEEKREEFDEYISQWCGKELGFIQTKRLNVTASRKRYDSLRKSWQRFIDESSAIEEADPPLFDNKDFLDEQQRREWEHARDKLKREYAKIMYEIAPEQLGVAAQALSLHAQIYKDPELTAGIKNVLTGRMQVFVNNTGRLATEKAASVSMGPS